MFPYHLASTVYAVYSMSAHTLDQEWKDSCYVWGPHAACPLGLGQSEGRCWCEGLAAWLGSSAAMMLCSVSSLEWFWLRSEKCLPRVHVNMAVSHMKLL